MRIFSIILFLSISCFLNSQTNVIIKGKCLNNRNYSSVSIDDLISNQSIAKDTILSDGSFKISLQIPSPNLYKLRLNYEGSGIYLVLKPSDNIFLTIDINDINNPQIQGSEDTKFVYSTIQELKNYDKKIEDEAKRLQAEKQDFLNASLKKNASSLGVLYFTDKKVIDSNIPLMIELKNALNIKYSDNAFVKDFTMKVEETTFLAIGTEAPEISLPDTSGKIKTLSSFRGKYVLIDFWASWCGPCRMANPKLVELYALYKNKNFEIFAVSLDKKRDAWIGAIKADKLGWVHVSDLKFWESDASIKYRVSGIPYAVLIDPQGKVIAKGIHAKDLEETLKKLIK